MAGREGACGAGCAVLALAGRQLGGAAIGPATLQVVDAQGRVVRVKRVAGGPAVLDLTGQAAWVYAVRGRTEAGRSGHARIALQP